MKWVDHEFYALRAVGRGIVRVALVTGDAICNWRQRRRARAYWHAWYAWRPVSVQELKVDDIVVPRHYVWLEWVDRRRSGWLRWTFRPHTMPAGVFETHRWDHYTNVWDPPTHKTADMITSYDVAVQGGR